MNETNRVDGLAAVNTSVGLSDIASVHKTDYAVTPLLIVSI